LDSYVPLKSGCSSLKIMISFKDAFTNSKDKYLDIFEIHIKFVVYAVFLSIIFFQIHWRHLDRIFAIHQILKLNVH